MKLQGEEFFQLTEDTIKKIKYIKLSKRASYAEKDLENVIYNKGMTNVDAIQFYSFGFYDSLMCFKSEKITSLAYKEHFLISYPFEKTANTLRVEQWFGIIPLSEQKQYSAGIEDDSVKDPFFCSERLQSELPFIGVILISLNNTLKNNRTNDFKKLLADYARTIANIFTNCQRNEDKYIAETYYSLNCADLCLVIRTDALPFIHRIGYYLNMEAVREGVGINTTIIFAVYECIESEDLEKISEKNKAMSFIVRSNKKYDKTSKGVNGIGKYVTSFDYSQYIRFLPQLICHKLNKRQGAIVGFDESYIRSICHEREWYIEEEYKEYDMALDKGAEELQFAICKWIKEIYDMIIKIETFGKHFFTYAKGVYKYKEIFTREFRLIKDLVYTYSDLWYQNASESGFVFFAQLMVALQGIETMLDEIEKISVDDDLLEYSVNNTLELMHWIACDLNGYNKQFQFLNQDSVNYPNYEIQSKVNAEKYMAAYCSFLHKFFALYYQEKQSSEEIVQNLPLALVNLNQRKIVTNIYFSSVYRKNKKDKNKDTRGMFAVHFPSSEYFSNIWNSIPLLMHEASHTHHYGKTIHRNEAVTFNIDYFFAQSIADKMVRIVNDGITVSAFSFLAEILKERIYKAIKICRDEMFRKKGDFENWGFQELLSNCKEFYASIFDKHSNVKNITYNQLEKLKSRIMKDVDSIMLVIGFDKICYAFIPNMNDIPTFCYFVNVLYLEFHPDFYQKYKKVYDNAFLESVNREINRDEKDDIEKEILSFTLYRFVKYVQHKNIKESIDLKMLKEIERHMTSSLGIAFLIMLIAAMRAIFEKYKDKFLVEISEKIYFSNLVPNLYTENITGFSDKLVIAYKSYKESDKSPSIHDQYLMESMFYEYYEIYLSVNNVIKFLNSRLTYLDNNKLSNTDIFIQCIHNECKNYILEEEKKGYFKPIFAKSNREQLIKLGFFENDDIILKEVFTGIFAECEDLFVENIIEDRAKLFKEVYADCGMCCAMGFDPFGYCMFALSIHNVVDDMNDVNEMEATSSYSNFLADRIRSVIRMYFDNSDRDNWPDILNRFLHKLFDIEMIQSICDMLNDICENEYIDKIAKRLEKDNIFKSSVCVEIKEIEKVFQQDFQEIFALWRDQILGNLISTIEKYYEDPSIEVVKRDKIFAAKTYLYQVYSVVSLFKTEDILPHISNDIFNGYFQSVKRLMDKGAGIKAVKGDVCVKEISRFYNMDVPNGIKNKFNWYYDIYAMGFITHCNFIFNNYCEYRNAYNNLKRNIFIDDTGNVIPKINQWFEIIDEYYRGGEN